MAVTSGHLHVGERHELISPNVVVHEDRHVEAWKGEHHIRLSCLLRFSTSKKPKRKAAPNNHSSSRLHGSEQTESMPNWVHLSTMSDSGWAAMRKMRSDENMIKSSMLTTPCENPRSEWESASTRPSCISRERSKHEEFWETQN